MVNNHNVRQHQISLLFQKQVDVWREKTILHVSGLYCNLCNFNTALLIRKFKYNY